MSDVLMTVATFGDPVEANLAKNRLESSGVQAFLADEETVNMDWLLGNAIGRIKLQVGDQDAEAARTLLSQHSDLDATAALGPEEIRFESSLAEPTPGWEDLMRRRSGTGSRSRRIRAGTDDPGQECRASVPRCHLRRPLFSAPVLRFLLVAQGLPLR